MRIPILTYHASQIDGNAYEHNSIRALEADLRAITDRGFAVWPLHAVVTAWLKDAASLEGRQIVALTCDDGTDYDFREVAHPQHGRQPSIYSVLARFRAARPADQPSLNITSFVVVSPAARAELDKACLGGRGWYNDDWWTQAAASGLMDIANHSWDHHHDALPAHMAAGDGRGTFRTVSTQPLADYQIRQAGDRLRSVAPNRGTELFAYPYGDPNDYLALDYLPRHAPELGLIAAFTGDAGFLEARTNRWTIPRFIFRRDWSSPKGLDRILDKAARRWW